MDQPLVWQGSLAATLAAIANAINTGSASTAGWSASASNIDLTLYAPTNAPEQYNGLLPFNSYGGVNGMNGVIAAVLAGGDASTAVYNEKLILAEHHLYGSDRLGMRNATQLMSSRYLAGPGYPRRRKL